MRSQARKEEQGHTQATKDQYGSEEARCSQTRTFKDKGSDSLMTTNDIPGCPNGGLLSGTDGRDKLAGRKGDDEIHGLGGVDDVEGGLGNDVIYGGPGDDNALLGDEFGRDHGDDVIYGGDGNDGWLVGGAGEDVFYGGKGNDGLESVELPPGRGTPMRDELYCGPGKDQYHADKLDYVDSSCEEKVEGFGGGIA